MTPFTLRSSYYFMVRKQYQREVLKYNVMFMDKTFYAKFHEWLKIEFNITVTNQITEHTMYFETEQELMFFLLNVQHR